MHFPGRPAQGGKIAVVECAPVDRPVVPFEHLPVQRTFVQLYKVRFTVKVNKKFVNNQAVDSPTAKKNYSCQKKIFTHFFTPKFSIPICKK